MAYFIPSYLQKRLLKYALSRLEILDTDALDLNSLDIAWGSRSTVELRDIGLRNDKLGPLLRLPSIVCVESTTVALVRLTVPADLYTSPIVIEIEHVTAKARVTVAHEGTGSKLSQRKTSVKQAAKDSHDDQWPELPNAQDLAQSFLEQEPDEEREELQAFVAKQPADSQQSISSDSTGDDEFNAGTGVGLSLPAFLAGFLKGISDRLQVNVQDISITLHLDMEDDVLLTPPAISLKVDSLKVHGIPQSKQTQDTSMASGTPDTVVVHAGRMIKLINARASILTDKASFDSTSRGSERGTSHRGPQSPTQTWSPSTTTRSGTDYHEKTTTAASPILSRSGQSITSALPEQSVDSLGSRFADADDDDIHAHFDQVGSANYQLEEHDDPLRHLSEPLETSESLSSGPHRSFDSLQSDRRRGALASKSQRLEERDPFFSHLGPGPNSSGQQTPTFRPQREPSLENNDPISEVHADIPASLSESRLFSHSDAESIYMSVTENNTLHIQDEFPLPGGWADTSIYNDPGPQSITRSPNPSRTDLTPGPALERPVIAKDSGDSQQSAREDVPGLDPAALHFEHQRTALSLSSAVDIVELSLFIIDTIEIMLYDKDEGPRTDDEDTFAAPKSMVESSLAGSKLASTSLSMSSMNAIPGAFSSYADITSRKRGITGGSKYMGAEANIKSQENNQEHQSCPVPPIEVTLGAMSSQIEMTAIPFLVRVCRRLHTIWSARDPEADRSSKDRSIRTEPDVSVNPNLIIQRLVLEVLDNSPVDFSPGNHIPSRISGSQDDRSNRRGSILTLNLDGLYLNWLDSLDVVGAKVTIDCITCDVVGTRVLSFDREATLGSSMRGAHAPVKDVSIMYGVTKGAPEISVVTLPIIFDLDFHKIDDMLSSFGGFSGLLELGSSFVSDAEMAAPPMPATDRPRAVRFESGVKSSKDEVQSGGTRVNVRINGGLVTLRGRDSTIRYRSSALKLVVRESAIGLQIDEIILDAPYKKHELPGLQLTLRNFSLKCLARPEEHDLSRLISLLTPSKDKFEEDDDLLLDTLMRQRKKGATMRVSVGTLDLRCNTLASIQKLQDFAIELSKLSVTKYLPEESRPGLLTLGLISKSSVYIAGAPKIGDIQGVLRNIEFAHVGAPALVAFGVQSVSLERVGEESLLAEVFPSADPNQPPMIMARFIGDEMEPTVKIKLWNMVFEYSVPLAEVLLGLGNTDPSVNVAADLTASLANLTDRPLPIASRTSLPSPSGSSLSQTKPPKLEMTLRDCALALNPQKLPSRALLVLTQAHLECALPPDADVRASLNVRKASLLLIDDAEKLLSPEDVHREASNARLLRRDQLSDLSRQGYISMSWISAATIDLRLTRSTGPEPNVLELDIGDELLVIEACADSTATLGALFGALAPKLPPAKGERYRTQIASMQDMMASFSGDAFALKPEDSRVSFEDAQDVADMMDDDMSNDFDSYDQFPGFDEDDDVDVEAEDNTYEYGFETTTTSQQGQSQAMADENSETSGSEIISGNVHISQMAPQISPYAKKWDSTNNKYINLSPSELVQSPIRIRARDMHVIWNLYDGYDWEKTRDVISKAVQEVQAKAEERRMNRRRSREVVDDEESVIGDFLFNSIYIGIPANHDPKELAQQINRDVDDMMTETGSHTSTTVTSRPVGSTRPLRPHGKKLRLQRSKRHKIAFELRGVSADYFAFPPDGETQSSLDVRIKDFEIYDHVPTSTWKKFLTYMHDAGPREDKKPMIHLELCDVRPIPELIASELVLRATVLPVRLHVDQDALDFMTRFFEFNESAPSSSTPPPKPSATAQPYLQRVEVYPVPLKLDYKPKRVDYAGIRSGRTNEFKNFFTLDGAEMVLKHAIIYGTSGFTKLHHNLEDVWTPDIMKNQLPSVLSGLSGVRTLVNVGAGMRDLVVVPVREYQKDGRIVRSISKGALAFARSTGGEITRFGAKLAVSAQTALQGAEEFLSSAQPTDSALDREWEDAELEETEKRAISHYADQPAGFLQGLRGAARSLERDLLLTRDVIVAISGEMRESDSAEGAARALARHAPTLVLRPMIGASKAIGQTLMGANNSVDPANRRRVEDKYKRY